MENNFKLKNKDKVKLLLEEKELKNFSIFCFILFFSSGIVIVPILFWFNIMLGCLTLCYFNVVCSIMYFSAQKHKKATMLMLDQVISNKSLRKQNGIFLEGEYDKNKKI